MTPVFSKLCQKNVDGIVLPNSSIRLATTLLPLFLARFALEAFFKIETKEMTLSNFPSYTNPAYTAPRMTLKAAQSVGQIIGEVMKQLDDDRGACAVSALTGGFVSHRQGLFMTCLIDSPENKLKTARGTRVSPDMTTLPSCAFNREKWTLLCTK